MKGVRYQLWHHGKHVGGGGFRPHTNILSMRLSSKVSGKIAVARPTNDAA